MYLWFILYMHTSSNNQVDSQVQQWLSHTIIEFECCPIWYCCKQPEDQILCGRQASVGLEIHSVWSLRIFKTIYFKIPAVIIIYDILGQCNRLTLCYLFLPECLTYVWPLHWAILHEIGISSCDGFILVNIHTPLQIP